MLPVKAAGAVSPYESLEAILYSNFLVFLQSAGCVDEINRWLDLGKILGLFRQNMSSG